MITRVLFGVLESGEKVNAYIMQQGGVTATVLDYGATLQSLLVPAAGGGTADVIMGYDELEFYELGTANHGAIVGRYANRIKNSAFTLNGREYKLTPNSGAHHLHGVLNKRLFEGEIQGDTLILRRLCPAAEEGFPGNLMLEVRYALDGAGALNINYSATTDADTVLNITNHSFFNLNGHASGDVFGHTLYINSDSYTEADDEKIPTGKILSVSGTPLDFRAGKTIGKDIFSDFGSVKQARGFDHNMIIGGEAGTLRKAAVARGDRSGVVLTVYTTQPAAQLYTANYVEEDAAPFGKGGAKYCAYGAFCFETQHYPASPNFSDFPSTLLRAGDRFSETTVWKFSLG